MEWNKQINKGLSILLLVLTCSFLSDTFKTDQLRYSRVREAYQDKESSMQSLLRKQDLNQSKLNIYLRAFKSDKQLELWGKNASDSKFKLIKTYEVCRRSGSIGPKRKQGDYQVPEGFYHINRFNPASSYHLSLGINYPNKSDRILGVAGKLGGDIFIHGDCVTIGCIPITDDEIKELYLFCIEAKTNGQKTIPVSIFPTRLSDDVFERMTDKYEADSDKIGLWTDLKKGYDLFNRTKQLPSIGFLESGRHNVQE